MVEKVILRFPAAIIDGVLGMVRKLDCLEGARGPRGLRDRRLQTARDWAKARARSVDILRPCRPFLSLSLVTAHMHSIRNCLH